MKLKGTPSARQNARRQRRQMSPPEVRLWLALRTSPSGHRYRRQHPAGPYSLDFYCAPARLAIEVDGGAHAMGDRPERDERRDAWLMNEGVLVLRFPARDVMDNLDGVMRHILIETDKRLG